MRHAPGTTLVARRLLLRRDADGPAGVGRQRARPRTRRPELQPPADRNATRARPRPRDRCEEHRGRDRRARIGRECEPRAWHAARAVLGTRVGSRRGQSTRERAALPRRLARTCKCTAPVPADDGTALAHRQVPPARACAPGPAPHSDRGLEAQRVRDFRRARRPQPAPDVRRARMQSPRPKAGAAGASGSTSHRRDRRPPRSLCSGTPSRIRRSGALP